MWWEGVSLQKGEEGGASRMLQLLIRKKKSILTLPTATFLFFFAESRVMPPPPFFSFYLNQIEPSTRASSPCTLSLPPRALVPQAGPGSSLLLQVYRCTRRRDPFERGGRAATEEEGGANASRRAGQGGRKREGQGAREGRGAREGQGVAAV